MRAVLDTNVVISSVVFAGKPARVLDLAFKKEITNIVSPFILDEIRRVLKDKFLWQDGVINKLTESIEVASEIVHPIEQINIIADDDDNRIIECAIEGHADFIISGDRLLLDLKTYKGVIIINPAAFLEIVHEHLMKGK